MISSDNINQSTDSHIKRYEQLRSQALGHPSPIHDSSGLILIRREGVGAWLNGAPGITAFAPNTHSNHEPKLEMPRLDENRSAIVRVLASMAMACREEMIL